ncbi:MAG: AI-2E family transporter, partial [Leptonema sp. (in: Bacteria)]|nr:AI-2E family transporter [Leptonema sp. (in: bacteria)]
GAYNYFLGGIGSSLSFVVNLLFSLILLFFLLRESESLYNMIRQAVPISGNIVDQFKDRMKEIILAILKGNLLIALLQGTMIGIGIWICGVPNALLYGSIATVLSIIPVIGTAFVWLPVSIYIYFFGHGPAVAIFLAIYGLACYLILENILKPKLLDRKLGVHSLLLFFAIIGGLKEFGITGIFLGPLILTIFLTIWRIYHIWGGGEGHDPIEVLPETIAVSVEPQKASEKQND